MPFLRATLAELIERIEAETSARLGLGPLLPRSVLQVLSRVLAGASHQLHGHLAYIARQVNPLTAESEELDSWATLMGVPRKAATFAQGEITVTATAAATIPAGTEYQSVDGTLFTVDTETVYSTPGPLAVAVTAAESGVSGNVDTGSLLQILSPIAGIPSTGIVASPGIAGGTDTETDVALRLRVQEAFQNPPDGSSASQYEQWALEVSGVTRAFALPLNSGVGTVDVTFVLDDDPTSIIPDSAKVDEVQAYIDARRPVGMGGVTVFAPELNEYDVFLSVTPDTAAVRAAVETSLREMSAREAEPGQALPISKVREAISVAEGEDDYELTSPTADVPVFSAAQLLQLRDVTFS